MKNSNCVSLYQNNSFCKNCQCFGNVLWYSWQSGCFWHQRSAVFLRCLYLLLTVEKTKMNANRPFMVLNCSRVDRSWIWNRFLQISFVFGGRLFEIRFRTQHLLHNLMTMTIALSLSHSSIGPVILDVKLFLVSLSSDLLRCSIPISSFFNVRHGLHVMSDCT